MEEERGVARGGGRERGGERGRREIRKRSEENNLSAFIPLTMHEANRHCQMTFNLSLLSNNSHIVDE